SVSTRKRLPIGSSNLNASVSCARPQRVFLGVTVAALLRNIASPTLPMARTRQRATMKNGRVNCSFLVLRGERSAPEKNRNPYDRAVHPVRPRRTYGRPGMGAPYVRPHRT